MKINPHDPINHDKPLWIVHGETCFPAIFCAKLRAYREDNALLPAGGRGPVVCVLGYSVYKREPGFRTLGVEVTEWAKKSGGMKPTFFDDQEEALALLRKLTTPKA
jgi:hypothetical protein